MRGIQTPLAGRIVAVATVFNALTSERVYRYALPRAEALQVIRGGAGTDFDPDVAAALIDVITQPDEFADTPATVNEPDAIDRRASASA